MINAITNTTNRCLPLLSEPVKNKFGELIQVGEGALCKTCHMPGNYYTRALFLYLFGYSIFIAFLPNLLSFIGSVIFLFLIANIFFDRRTAYITVILFMLFPPFLLYSFSAMQEMLFVFTCLLSFYIFTRLPRKTRYIYGGLALLLPFLIRETAAFMVFGFATMIYLEHKQEILQSCNFCHYFLDLAVSHLFFTANSE